MLLRTAKGPVTSTVTVQYFGASLRKRASLAASSKLDDAACPTVHLGFARVMVSKPSRLPALVLLAPLLANIIRTLRVAVYREEMTCLVRTHIDVLSLLEEAVVPQDAFVRGHSAKDAHGPAAVGPQPRWIFRVPTESAAQYYDRIVAMAAGCKANICFRSGDSKCLGLIGGAAASAGSQTGVLAPRWSMTSAKEFWAQDRCRSCCGSIH